jgi:DNA-binding NtrC family response regulator
MATVLIVEDEIFVRETAEWIIEDIGYDALVAEDLGQALAFLAAPGEIDALFVDIRLNALLLGGYDVANQAIGLRPALRVLYTSGSPLCPAMTNRFVEGGQFLQKPYSPSQLGVSLEQLLP